MQKYLFNRGGKAQIEDGGMYILTRYAHKKS